MKMYGSPHSKITWGRRRNEHERMRYDGEAMRLYDE